MKWRKSVTTENCVSFYCPHGDFSDGTFVAIIELTLVDIFIYTLDNTHRRLEMALRATNRIAWNNKPLFIGMNTAYLDMMLNIGKEKHYPSVKYPLGNMFWLAKEKALQYEYCIPTEIYVAPLQDDHVVQINSTWPTKAPGTYEYLSKLLALNGGTGFFLKDSNELCAWYSCTSRIMTTEDILQQIPDEKLPELKELYLQNWPSTSHVYNFIDTCMELRKSVPTENNVTLFCPNGDFSDGTFVAIIKLTICEIFIYTLDSSCTRLEMALMKTKIIEWNNKPLFLCLNIRFLSTVLKVTKANNYPTPKYPLADLYRLPKETALQFSYSIPSELYTATLEQHHVAVINSKWVLRASGTEEYLVKLLKLNGGIGLFTKTTNELCAWVFKNCFGGLRMLQTDEKFRRRGYASLLIKIFAKQLAQRGIDPTTIIYRNNIGSQKLFTGLGFEAIMDICVCQF
ncbi:uncharacterized protein CBL_03785 [Carabus blaptoides fortunei]